MNFFQRPMTSFKSKRPYISNLIFFCIIFISGLYYIYVYFNEPDFTFIFLTLLIDIPLFGYIIILLNSVRYSLEHDHIFVKWFMGSFKIDYDNIVGYFDYTIPLFEVHLEVSWVGATIKRNNIGEFRLLSPGIRKGMIIECGKGNNIIELLFISPKHKDQFITELITILRNSVGYKFEEYKGRFFKKLV